MDRVPRAGRILDLAGLLLLLVGAAMFARAWIGFEEVRHFETTAADLPWAATRLANGYLRLQRAGGAAMLAGVAVFVVAWWVAGRKPTALRTAGQKPPPD